MATGASPGPLPGTPRALTGWGRTASSVARVWRVTSASEACTGLQAAPRRGVTARGFGRSYGDAAQNGGGLVLDTTGIRAIGPVEVKVRGGGAATDHVVLRVAGKSIPARRDGDQMIFTVESILDHEVVQIPSR